MQKRAEISTFCFAETQERAKVRYCNMFTNWLLEDCELSLSSSSSFFRNLELAKRYTSGKGSSAVGLTA